METYYLGTLYRFGGNITCLDTDASNAVKQIMDRYEKMYRESNDGDDPHKIYEHNNRMSDYDVAEEDIELEEYKLGEAIFY